MLFSHFVLYISFVPSNSVHPVRILCTYNTKYMFFRNKIRFIIHNVIETIIIIGYKQH